MARIHGTRVIHLGSWLLGTAAMLPAIAHAQSAPAPATQPAAEPEIGDIIVTAQKRAQRLTDIGINVAALSERTISESRITQIENLASAIPNVDIKEQVPGAIPVVTVRGIGLDDFSATNSPSVGVYIDEVPLASTALMSGELYDTARIELLKGPQGTLYGRNSTAGALNIITARPELDGVHGSASAGYGNYQAFDAEGYLNLPLGSDAALRLSARTVQQGEGYWTSRLLPGTTIGERHIVTGRLQLRWKPGPDADFNLKVEGLRSRSEMGQGEFFGTINPLTGGLCAPILAGHVDNSRCTDFFGYTDTDGDPFKGDWARKAFYDLDSWDATLTGRIGLGGGITLSTITGYRWQKRGFDIDSDATPARQVDFLQNDRIEQFTQEVRLNGTTGPAEWILGGFYSHDRVKVFTPGNQLDLFATTTVINADQKTDSAAAFGNVDWKLAEHLKLVTGLRLTWEQRSYVGGTTDLNPLGASLLCIPAGLCTPGVPGPVALSFLDARISNTNLTGRIALEYAPAPGSLIYASIARGMKSGGFFSGLSTSNLALTPYRPEKLTAYEVGAKAELAGRSLLINASAFYYDYRDVQTFVRADNGPIPVQKLGNVPYADVKGIDLDMTWRPVRGLDLFGGIGLLHTSLSAFTTTAGLVPKGNKLPNAPDFTFTGRARYQWAIGPLKASVQGSAHYSDPVFKDAINDPVIRAGAYWLFDARLALGAGNDRWEVAVWGKNLTDNEHVVQGLDVASLGFGNRTYNAPRTYGATLTVRFK
jgi:iron complex outermembrane receptor protein